MAGQASTAGANIGLDAITGRATQTARTMYLALLTAAPTDSTTMASMTELTTPGSNGYSRQAVTFSAPSSDPSSTSNTSTVTFGPFSSDLGNVTHCALVSASTGTSGDLTFYWTLDAARDPANGDSISFAASALVATLD
jgi:hypothetical protein